MRKCRGVAIGLDGPESVTVRLMPLAACTRMEWNSYATGKWKANERTEAVVNERVGEKEGSLHSACVCMNRQTPQPVHSRHALGASW